MHFQHYYASIRIPQSAFSVTSKSPLDTINLFLYEPIYFRDGSYINELKAIIKLYEHKEDLKEFICKFIQALDPMFESVRILKTALQ